MIRICAITRALRDSSGWMRRAYLAFRIAMSENIVVGVEVLRLESAWHAPMVHPVQCISVLENHTTITVAAGSVKMV